MTNVCSTVILLSNQSMSTNSVHKSDKMRRPGRWFQSRVKLRTEVCTACSVKGALPWCHSNKFLFV